MADDTGATGRRQLLEALGASAVLGVAGCQGQDPDDDSEDQDQDPDADAESSETADTDADESAPASFSVQASTAETTVDTDAGTLTVGVSVENIGEQRETQTVELHVADSVIASREVTLAGGASQMITFADVDVSDLSGKVSYAIVTQDERADSVITIAQPAQFELRDPAPDETSVTNGTQLSISVRVDNTGTEPGTAEVDLVIHGNTRSTRQVSVDGGKSTTMTFTDVATDGLSGEVPYAVRTADDRVSGSLTVVYGDSDDWAVGVHYYPWYEMTPDHEGWTEQTVTEPQLGEYAADDSAVVDQHITWSREHGIDWWSISWWGPETQLDTAVQEAILDAEGFDELEFSMLYETIGRLGEFGYDLDQPGARDRLRADLRYIADTYVTEDNYFTIDERPVVYFYATNALRGDVAAAFDAVMANMDTDFYILADTPFGAPPDTAPIAPAADAVTSYNPYTARPDIEDVFDERYDQGNTVMHLGADAQGLEYVPVVIPGYDDTGIPDAQREDNPVLSPSPSRFEQVCNQVSPHLADSPAVLVTSFNEWYEDTQIEPSEEYGTAYLDRTKSLLADGESSGFAPTGRRLTLTFNKTIVPAEINTGSSDDRELAFMLGGLTLYDGSTAVRSFNIGSPADEPLFLKGAYATNSRNGQSWRWLGGQSAETVVFIQSDIAAVDRVVLTGQPMQSDEIEADVSLDGGSIEHIEFGARDGFDEYEITLS